jgi:hypothetical protein
VVRPPTQAMKRLPLRVQLTLRTARKAQAIRTPDGGPPPAVISLSQFKLQALREVQYNSSEVSEDMIVTYIDIAPKTLPVMPVKLETRYERLWDHRVFDKEQELAQAQVKAARDLAVGAQHGSAYPELLDAVRTRFDQINFPLLPGEDRAIAKMLAYTVDEAPSYEGGHHLSNTMWFPRLCQTLAHSTRVAQMHRSDILTDFLLEAITYDAAMSAFDIVTARWKERLGTPQEQTDHAVRLMRALVGIGEMDLMCIYIPLILGGLAVDRLVNIPQPDDPWELVCDLRQAVSQRFGDDGDPIIIKLIERMLREVEHEVQRYKKNSGWRG